MGKHILIYAGLAVVDNYLISWAFHKIIIISFTNMTKPRKSNIKL